MTPEQHAMRAATWRPKLPEVAEQCASCPFRIGNDAEWKGMVEKLREKFGMKGRVTKALCARGRIRARMDLEVSGDFACHFTAYDKDMNLRPASEHRQCLGASRVYRGEAP